MNIEQFDYSVNLLQSMIWQYDNATRLKSLVSQKQDWYNVYQSQFWEDWYNNVFNLLTANAFGLSVWSVILNLPLFLGQVESPSKPVFGFNRFDPTYPDLLNGNLNFENSNFSIRGTVIFLTLEQQRFLLRLRYYQLCSRGDVTDVNEFLNYLITTSDIGYSGTLYMVDNLDMTITYVFTASNFSADLLTVIEKFDVLPRPTGVKIIYSI